MARNHSLGPPWISSDYLNTVRTSALIIKLRNCTEDEGRTLGAGLQEQASNPLKPR